MIRALTVIVSVFALAGCGEPDTLRSLPKAPDGSPGSITAFGHAPNWSLTIDKDRWTLTGLDANLERSGKTGNAEFLPEGGWRYAKSGMQIDLKPGPCADALTGERFFDTVEVNLEGQQLTGCGGPMLPPADLAGTSWRGNPQIPEPGGLILREFAGSMTFADGRVIGSTGCNRFSAGYQIDDDQLTLNRMVMTKRACTGSTGQFERRFLDLFAGPVSFRFLRSGVLALTRGPDRFLTFEPEE